VRRLWCADAFTVGFKLETDPEILAFKAVSSLRKYGMHVVGGVSGAAGACTWWGGLVVQLFQLSLGRAYLGNNSEITRKKKGMRGGLLGHLIG
jgi:hypothetical protein